MKKICPLSENILHELTNNYRKKNDSPAFACTLQDEMWFLSYISSKDDMVFTLFYIKRQANEIADDRALVPALPASVRVKVVFSIDRTLEFARWPKEFVLSRESHVRA